MEGYLVSLLWTAVAVSGTWLGGAAAEFVPVTPRRLSIALHAAAGTVLAIVGVELMPRARLTEVPWAIVLAFIAGGAAFLLLDWAVGITTSQFGGEQSGPWVLYSGFVLDLISDGVMIGTGSAITAGLGLVLALGQAVADAPSAFAIVAALRRRRTRLKNRLGLLAGLALPLLVGATAGYWGVRGQPHWVRLVILTFTAGMLTSLVVEEIVPRSHEGRESTWAAVAMILAFAGFTLLSLYTE